MDANKQKLAWALGCLTALSGCSSLYSGKEYSALHINPVMNVRHADTSAENLYHLGRYYHRMLSYANAIATYQKALMADPDYVEAHNALGVVYSSQGDYSLALEHFQKAIELTPTATYLHNNLGYAYLLQERYREAADAFREALHFDPSNSKASRNLATVQKRMGLNEQDAIASIDPATEQRPAIVTLTANAPQSQIMQLSSPQSSQSLVQVAPQVYEFRNEDQKPAQALPAAPATTLTAEPEPIRASRAIPVTASTIDQPIQLTPLVADRAAEVQPREKTDTAAIHPHKIEVSNGNGVTGMARNIATYLKQFGFDNTRLTNHETFRQAHTEIHYHPSALALAEKISQLMPSSVKIMETAELRSDTQLKILLGQDIASEVAFFNKQETIQLAQNDSNPR
ncbi:tetratricopeptide repeat protein [Nitrosomonas nitrosa]|uniref:LytR C-terminal domain-containing protein n=1 Tax=Nitrosomonas nitrosa TaxID=52442 RepID=UPI000D2F9864|nr:LytR C-terminal domain-containing protein [Nitrosomonas nitrosa]PTR04524.1 tetratricopeptide repeat protein [Nitrosomonas nitrosa]